MVNGVNLIALIKRRRDKMAEAKVMQELAERLIDRFIKDEVFSEVCIYVNGKRYRADNNNNAKECQTAAGNRYFEENGEFDPAEYLDHCNSKTVTITFEGPLYDMINYMDYDYIYKLDQDILNDYGMYFEQGNNWNMSAYVA